MPPTMDGRTCMSHVVIPGPRWGPDRWSLAVPQWCLALACIAVLQGSGGLMADDQAGDGALLHDLAELVRQSYRMVRVRHDAPATSTEDIQQNVAAITRKLSGRIGGELATSLAASLESPTPEAPALWQSLPTRLHQASWYVHAAIDLPLTAGSPILSVIMGTIGEPPAGLDLRGFIPRLTQVVWCRSMETVSFYESHDQNAPLMDLDGKAGVVVVDSQSWHAGRAARASSPKVLGDADLQAAMTRIEGLSQQGAAALGEINQSTRTILLSRLSQSDGATADAQEFSRCLRELQVYQDIRAQPLFVTWASAGGMDIAHCESRCSAIAVVRSGMTADASYAVLIKMLDFSATGDARFETMGKVVDQMVSLLAGNPGRYGNPKLAPGNLMASRCALCRLDPEQLSTLDSDAFGCLIDAAVCHIAERLISESQTNKAVELLTDGVVHFPAAYQCGSALATAYMGMGQPFEAELQIRRQLCLDIRPQGQALLASTLGQALFEQGETREAFEVLTKSLAVIPDDAMTVFFLAKCEIAHGERERAGRRLREALARDPHSPIAPHMREVMDLLGDHVPEAPTGPVHP
jgi:tetratricopeptide (TPR) repeat protein